MEAFEHASLLVRSDADAAVGHRHHDRVIHEVRPQRDLRSRRRELHRVVDEVPQDLFHAVGVDHDHVGSVSVHLQRDPVGVLAERREQVAEEADRCHGLRRDRELSGLDLGRHQQVLLTLSPTFTPLGHSVLKGGFAAKHAARTGKRSGWVQGPRTSPRARCPKGGPEVAGISDV